MEFGILADKLGGTKSVPVSEIRPPLSTLKGIQAEYLKGITKQNVILLNAERILSDHKIVVHEKVEI